MNWRTLDGMRPSVIAHRGASGLRPEHTLGGYALALAQGADVIEPDLVPSADGVLFCRHEPWLARSTDLAERVEFAAMLRDGDCSSATLSATQIDRLRAVQPFPGRSAGFDRSESVPRFSALIEWAAQAAAERMRAVVLYPEIKHPAELAAAGCDPLPPFVDAVRALPPGVDVRVQCFEIEPLRRVFDATGLPCTLLVEAGQGPALRSIIAEHAGWLAALGVDKRLLWHGSEDSGLIAAAHAAGLRIDAWTYRDDAPVVGQSIEQELAAAMRLGVDGVFCDFPATALQVRRMLERAD